MVPDLRNGVVNDRKRLKNGVFTALISPYFAVIRDPVLRAVFPLGNDHRLLEKKRPVKRDHVLRRRNRAVSSFSYRLRPFTAPFS